MLFKNYKDHSDSILEACLYKLSFLRKSDRKEIITLSNDLAEILKEEKKNISDKSDFIAYRNICSRIMELAALFLPSIKTNSRWIYPLIIECYEILNIEHTERIILISQYPEKRRADTSDGFAVFFDIMKAFDGVLPDHITDHQIDLFIIPSEAQFDFSSLAILGHELGHVLWKLNYQSLIERITTKYFDKYLKEHSLTQLDLFERKNTENRFISHIQEYFCDEVGRKIFSVVFDIALLKIIGINADTSSSESHPPSKSRAEVSIEKLKACIAKSKHKTFEKSISKFLEDFELDASSSDSQKNSLVEVVSEIFFAFTQKNHPFLRHEVDLNRIWDGVSQELNSFRPPIEEVSDKAPQIIPPVNIVIGTVLYYYNNENLISKNEYFLNSDDDVSGKFLKIKGILKEHLMYSINLGLFLKECQEKNNIDLDNLKNTLWTFRSRSAGGISNPLTVVPSISPNSQYGQNSIDLRLGGSFLVHKPSKYTHISPYPGDINIESFYVRINQSPREEFVLHPHQFVLASTMEYVSLPYDYYALVLGRSSWGRLGLNIATATAVQSGFRGCITLELRNLGETPLPLIVGARIAQLCIIKTPTDSTHKGYYSGKNKYIGPIKAEIPKLDIDSDWDLLLN